MVKDFKYILKRILIGVGIALALMFIKGNLIMSVSALDYNADEYQVCGTGYGCTTQSSLPVTNSYGNEMYGYYYTIPFTNGHTYSINFYISMYAKDLTINSGWPKMYLYSNNSTTTIVPDRYENLYVSYIGADRYAVTWSFELDVVGDFVGCQLRMKYNSSFQNTFTYTGIHDMQLSITDLTTTGGSSNDDIINNNNQNTQSIINNQNNNTNNIINNNTQNTQNIINNQNSNTDKEIESQKVCTVYDKSSGIQQGYFNSNGTINTGSSSSDYVITDFINITGAKLEALTAGGSNVRTCFFNTNKSFVSCINTITVGELTIPSDATYVRFSIQKSNNRPTFKICQNGNQAIVNSQENINNTLNDDTPVDNSTINGLFSDIEDSDTPISDLLTMPITLLQAYISGMSGTCSRIELGQLYGNMLFIPCINIENYLGSDLWNLIDIVLAMYLIYEFSQLLITAFDSITSLKDNFSWLFGVEGKHIGAPSTRVERNSDLY